MFIPAGYITYFYYEFGHWIAGELLGNNMVFSLNGVWPETGNYINPGDSLFVNLGGPDLLFFNHYLS